MEGVAAQPGNAGGAMRTRAIVARRFSDRPQPNAKPHGKNLRDAARLAPEAERLLSDAAKRWAFSARAVHRTLRVARTIAHLAATERISTQAIAEALAFRHGTLKQSSQGRALAASDAPRM